ncbi:hypothetical protein AB0N17_09290 [Streptomyces sp. NPDC051133]|uniref:hypothetical protein n=1 Tax=Streptomyces sp. NPDC051133 TaxID=3155521 RepID=UPI00341D6423
MSVVFEYFRVADRRAAVEWAIGPDGDWLAGRSSGRAAGRPGEEAYLVGVGHPAPRPGRSMSAAALASVRFTSTRSTPAAERVREFARPARRARAAGARLYRRFCA